MDTVQDLHALEQRICTIVEDFLYYGGSLNTTAGIVITKDLDIVEVSEMGEVDGDYYPLKELVSEDGDLELDVDKIKEVASRYVFVR